jgi:hypothetical protein
MFVVLGQRPRTVAIAPQAGTEAHIGLIKKDSTNTRPATIMPCLGSLQHSFLSSKLSVGFGILAARTIQDLLQDIVRLNYPRAKPARGIWHLLVIISD